MNNWKENSLIASRKLNLISTEEINKVLLALADKAEEKCEELLVENQKDLASMDKSNPLYDRLLLTKQRIFDIASDIRKVVSLESPVGRILESRELANGLKLTKKAVPFGVIGIIYEARPNVSFDVFSLCFKTANVCVLKGGTDAYNSNFAIVNLIKEVLREHNLDENMVHLLPAGREATGELLSAVGYIDLIIPRGSAGLIKYVRENSQVPVIETGAGVVHCYFDKDADLEKGKAIIENAKADLEIVRQLIEEKRFSELKAYLMETNPADIAELLNELQKEQYLILYRLLPKELAAEVFVDLDVDLQEALIGAFSDVELKQMLDELYLDDTVDIIEEMPASVVKRILKQTDRETRNKINRPSIEGRFFVRFFRYTDRPKNHLKYCC